MIRVGTSGWSYDHWTDVLYPPGTPAGQRLARYVEAFDTVELNASFYRWPPDARFAAWRERLPPGFAMTVKAPRGLTHGKRLYDPEVWLERMTRGWRALGDRAGCMIVQLPPDMQRDDDRLDYFLARVPDGMTTAVELRHPTWNDEAVFALLERHGTAYCVVSGAHIECILRATARTVYLRFHGPSHDRLYEGSYSDDDLGWWADRIREWTSNGHDVWAYFNNDGHGHAVRNALTLRRFLGG
ncbi:hypothetical protein MSA03_15970 [Microbacterium saccharophilum]|uniref:DUF72 domain-containing protein n=1 Tax=Microbacterium saccharophilum TaxID=1213358 RepID=UPI001194D47F|nr:DUF72 domain-containing protein [Microbacterium saccharophilum]GEP48089.1 hypothetical protein MSA03_15970 [Microbacterium saccharophilum]